MNGENDASKTDLRPVLARLREIERKCASMASRNEEFPLMRDRVEKIIARLEAGEEPDGGDLDYRRIARELFPVAHLFESTGFMSVGKEIGHIERSLVSLAPEGDDVATSSSPASPRIVSSSAAKKQPVEPEPEPTEEEPAATSVPVPIIVGLLLLVVAAVVSTAIILGVGPFARSKPLRSARSTEAAVQPTATPAPPQPTPGPKPTAASEVRPTPIPRGRLAGEVSAARLALATGDFRTAAVHLSEAARIDRTEPDLKEIAQQVVLGYVGSAYDAANNARWDEAAPHLELAERTAMRFGIDTSEIEEARTRIAAMERFVIIGPGDRRVVLRSIGRRVDVLLVDGGTRSGRIEGIEGTDLVLDVDSKVGGGAVSFTEEIPLTTIRSIKIYED